jgi:hypothetical protein
MRSSSFTPVIVWPIADCFLLSILVVAFALFLSDSSSITDVLAMNPRPQYTCPGCLGFSANPADIQFCAISC